MLTPLSASSTSPQHVTGQRYPSIFEPGRIGNLTAKNRLVLPPIVRNYADDAGRATPRYVAHIERIARGGVGTIILEASFVRQDGKGFRHQLGIHDDSMKAGLESLVEAAHRHGALAGIQLFHGGRQASANASGSQPVAPTAIPDPVVNELPRELDTEEIARIAAAFGEAAARAKDVGFDFVEIHGAHGYLVAQFLSPFSNRRTDAYGGSPENRRRFLEDVYAAVRLATGEVYPITVRLSGEETVPGGLTIDDTVASAKRMEGLGVAALHISTGSYATYAQGTMIPPMAVDDGVLLPLAARVKASVGIPVIAVGKLRTPEMIERALEEGQADFAAIGRSLLADPDWPQKIASGRRQEIRHCIACNQGCIGRLFAQQSVWCTINAETGRERTFERLSGGAGRRLLVAGGGPAGMTAARYGAMAGFDVTLYESRAALGGQLVAAAAAPHRKGWADLREYLITELRRLDVEVHLDSPVDAEVVSRETPHAVIVATGAEPIRATSSVNDGMPVVTGRDILERTAEHRGRVVVAGGGCSGAQTAEYLASQGREVALLEATGDIAIDAPTDERALLLARLHARGVKLMPNTRLLSMTTGKAVVSSPHETLTLPADMVVLCLGSEPVRALADDLDREGTRFFVVGDALGPRKVTEAIADGALAILDLVGAELGATEREEILSLRTASSPDPSRPHALAAAGIRPN